MKNELLKVLTIHPQRLEMLIEDIESYKIVGIETEWDNTEREIVLDCLKLVYEMVKNKVPNNEYKINAETESNEEMLNRIRKMSKNIDGQPVVDPIYTMIAKIRENY